MNIMRFSQIFDGVRNIYFRKYKANKTRTAFTLAEVLITLGIIGVVAALTMPSLVANYQKKLYITQLKKEYNVLENGIRLLLTEEGVDEIKNSSLYIADNDEFGHIDASAFKNAFKLSDMPDNSKFNKWLSPSNTKGMFFNDGSCVAVGYFDAYKASAIFLDTNCDKGPNSTGYDRFIGLSHGKNMLFNQISTFLATYDDIESARNDMRTLKSYKDDDEDVNYVVDLNAAMLALPLIIQDNWDINY